MWTMRSKLFVPGSRPELFAKALASAADALSFDLEDSVVPERKDEARGVLARWITSGALRGTTKTIIVRVNGMDTPYFAEDIATLALSGVHLINLPKPAGVEAVQAAAAALEQAERTNRVATPIKLLLNIESAGALRMAFPLASAHPRVAGLQLGLGDLFEPLGIDRREPAAVENAMFIVRMAAGDAGYSLMTLRSPTSRTRKDFVPRRNSRSGSAFSARAASIRRRSRWPTKCFAQAMKKSHTRCACSKRPRPPAVRGLTWSMAR